MDSASSDAKTRKIEPEKTPNDPYLGMVLGNSLLEKK